jgi:hypothetical protein
MDSNDTQDHWAHFLALVHREWGTADTGGGARFTIAARAAANDTDDALAIVKMRQVCFAQREIHNLVTQVLQLVRGEVKAQEAVAQVPVADYSRRGGL